MGLAQVRECIKRIHGVGAVKVVEVAAPGTIEFCEFGHTTVNREVDAGVCHIQALHTRSRVPEQVR